MSTAASSEPRVQTVRVTRDQIIAHLDDGRVISVPLAWSWRLSEASATKRANFRIIGSGQGIHWPDIDEDISVDGMLHGAPARRPKADNQPVVADRARARTSKKRVQPPEGKSRRS